MVGKKSKILKTCLVIVMLLVLGGLALFEFRNLLGGPQLTIEHPQSGMSVQKPQVTIAGTAKNISEIKLNGRKIFVDAHGKFKEKTYLSEGYNKVTVEVKDRFNKTKREELELVLN